MAEDLEDKEATPQIEIVDEGFKLEVIEEEVEKDDATLALEAKLAEKDAALEEYKAKLEEVKGSKPDTSVEALAAEIKKMAQPSPPQVEVKPQVDYAALFETTDKNFYNSPSKSVVDVMSPVLQSMDSKMTEIAKKNELKMSKLMVLADDSLKGDYVKYKDEVDKIVSSLKPSEEVYAKAVKLVKANHIDDIISEQVAAKLADMEAKLAEITAKNTQKAPSTFTNANQVQAAQAKNVMRVTARQLEIGRKFAIQKGYDWANAEEQEWVLTYLKGKGVI